MNTTTEAKIARREERWFIVRLLVLLAIAVGVFVLLSMARSNLTNAQFPRAKLPDGTWLVARSVTTGTKHPVEIPYPIDTQFSRWQRSYTNSRSTSNDRMVIWVTHENTRGEILDLDWFAKCELVEGESYRVSPRTYERNIVEDYSSGSAGASPPDGFSDATLFGSSKKVQMALICFELPLIRPREGAMKLDVYDGSGSVIAQLSIPYPQLPNPIQDDWEVDELPVTRTMGNLSVTLNSMKYHRHRGQRGISGTPLLTFVHDGMPSTTWSPYTETLDQLGNVTDIWNCDLSPLEPAWKLRMKLNQSASGRFLPEETRKLPLKPMAADRKVTFLNESYTVNNVPISLLGIGGKGPVHFTLPTSAATVKSGEYVAGQPFSGMSTSCSGNVCNVELTSGHPFLLTSDYPAGQNSNIQLMIRDQDGEALSQGGMSGTQGMMFWYFEPRPTTTAIEVEIISQQSRTVEFVIAPPKPEEIQQNQ